MNETNALELPDFHVMKYDNIIETLLLWPNVTQYKLYFHTEHRKSFVWWNLSGYIVIRYCSFLTENIRRILINLFCHSGKVNLTKNLTNLFTTSSVLFSGSGSKYYILFFSPWPKIRTCSACSLFLVTIWIWI